MGGEDGKVFMEGKRELGRAMPRAVWMPRIAMVSALVLFLDVS